jgi:hypothetical protein
MAGTYRPIPSGHLASELPAGLRYFYPAYTSDRRMRKTARPVVWEGARAQSLALDPIPWGHRLVLVSSAGISKGKAAANSRWLCPAVSQASSTYLPGRSGPPKAAATGITTRQVR